jgi:hypothetical protein
MILVKIKIGIDKPPAHGYFKAPINLGHLCCIADNIIDLMDNISACVKYFLFFPIAFDQFNRLDHINMLFIDIFLPDIEGWQHQGIINGEILLTDRYESEDY